MLFNRSEVDTKFNHNFFPVPEASPTNATFSKCTSLNEHVIHADQSECNFVNRGETCQSGRMSTNQFFLKNQTFCNMIVCHTSLGHNRRIY